MTSTREQYPAGVPCYVDTWHPDPAAATEFYGGVFGWKFQERGPQYYVGTLPDGDAAGVGPGEPAQWNTYVSVEDADAAVGRAEEAGGTVVIPPQAFGDIGRFAYFADPEGAMLGVWEPSGYPGVGVVNAPGSWNWSNLHTADVAAATRFYTAVFDWEVREVELAPGYTGTIVTVPGYGDHLAQRDPDIRERHAGEGAPEGFTDSIGWFEPLAAGMAPHWHVTFSSEDTDASVARAYERGAEIVAAPFDAGVVRMAVLRDPQGALFSVNTYTGEG